ncbi:MAG: bifunctional metallophosphatase/5'-nucleotidase [Ruminococcus sp.]|nr:bifunctional metallophosphatase/5'-nucleotidase [Ruminococcus sp.]
MRKLKSLVCCLFLAVLLSVCQTSVAAEAQGKEVDIMFLHDVHSHFDTFATVQDGESVMAGGLSRIKTLIDEKKEENPDTLVLDGGDFSMGTLVQSIFREEASELRMLGLLECEVTTLGNHEFDYRSAGLAEMLSNASGMDDVMPQMVLCNVDWDSMEAEGLTEEQAMLKDAFESYGVKDYTMITKGDVNIAVIGVFGVDALDCAPMCVLTMEDPVEAVKETVEEIQKNENADMIVCVSHSGTWEDEEKSEDEILAKEVPELDLIVSGHTHTTLDEPIVHGDTYIVSCGEYGENLGSLSMTQKADGRWSMESYELIPITEEVEQDEATQERIDFFMEIVDDVYLEQFGYERTQVLATNDVEFCTVSDLSGKHEEGNLGSIIADAYVYAVENAEDYNGIPVDFAVAPAGTIRETYAKGDITVENVYNSFSLGIGPDEIPGYPLVSLYLTGAELKILAEIDASVSDLMTSARLYTSGLQFEFNPNRMILNRVTDCYLVGENGERIEIEDDKLYRGVTDLYSCQMLGSVTDMSFGLLSLQPKDENGNVHEDLENGIVTETGSEIKAWAAIAEYMDSFEDTDGDGVSNVPASYGENQGRKVVDDSKNLLELVKNPNKYAAMIIAVVLVLIILVVLIIVLIVKLVKRIRRKSDRKKAQV